jgi:hypothetical protein
VSSKGVSSGREPGGGQRERTQAATARFTSQEALQNALQRLQGLELAGHTLEVAVVEEEPTPAPSQARDFQPPLPKGDPPPLPKGDPPPLPPPPPNESTAASGSAAYAPVPLAPHLGYGGIARPSAEVADALWDYVATRAGCTSRRRRCSSTSTRARRRASYGIWPTVCLSVCLSLGPLAASPSMGEHSRR